ncbi:MAG: DNA methyltransferase, partial [Acidobacteriota bacterium]
MTTYVQPNSIVLGDSREVLKQIKPESIACSIWSPPYHVGKGYGADMTFEEWRDLLRVVIDSHFDVLKPGAFLVINIADILCFKDPTMPKIMAENVSRRRINITKKQILEVMKQHPDYNRYQIAELLGCSEQTIDRRLNGSNIRGGKYETQTRVKIVSGMLEEMCL